MLITENGSRVLSYYEWKSLLLMLTAVSNAIARLPSDVDFVGAEHYYAMSMWLDLLQDASQPLDSYLPQPDEYEPIDTMGAATVEAWLLAYGKLQDDT